MANTSCSMWKTECLILRGITGFLLILSSFCHAHASADDGGVDLMKRGGGCMESERRSLLAVKAGMYQPPGDSWLSTWRDNDTDCCSWQGVGCDNVTGHVVKLDLHYPDDLSSLFDEDVNLRPGPSKLNSSLLGLIHLKHLDLSMNNFSLKPIPEFLGSLVKLEYLNLSNACFSGTIPPHLGNLTKLRSLDLDNTHYYFPLSIGKDLHWLSTITSLEYLDMSCVNLSKSGDSWIHDINMLPSLSVLLLSNVDLENIPNTLPHINLTSLDMLDLSGNNFSSPMPSWLFNITSLRRLNLEYCLFKEVRILKVLTSFGKLEYLNLAANDIIGRLPETLGNFTGLINLDLSKNEITGGIPKTIGKLCNLQSLDMSGNKISGKIPEVLGNSTSLIWLVLSENEITGEIPKSIGKLYKLQSLYLDRNYISGKIPETLGRLCKLHSLRLSSNKIAGEITSLVEELSRCSPGSDLHELYLYGNNLSGTIPAKLGQLSKLEYLVLSSNSFVGGMTEAHFSNLINLDWLYLSHNHLEMIFSPDWVPPFNASTIIMSSCHLGPAFPNWIRTQTMLAYLYMSEAGISGNIPSWFWNQLSKLEYLDMSNNQIRGQLPPSLQRIQYSGLNLSSNCFDGHIPNIDPTNLYYIDLSNNSFCGPIPSSLAAAKNIGYLSLSNNHLSGTIPPFSVHDVRVLDLSSNNLGGRLPLFDCPQLLVLDLSSNNFSSHIPDSVGSLTNLQSLHLRNNSLTGSIPWSLRHCQQLVILDLGENRLSGDIPSWIGEHLPLLRVLRLRSNFFRGDISFPKSNLTNLQVLDLADNNLSGILSPSSLNFSAMFRSLNVNKTIDMDFYYYTENLVLTVKGMELLYTTVDLSLVISIDLSCNGFYGEIPKDLTELHGLVSLNLSRNHFTGEIPENIGALGQLDSLDLSMNNLSGSIPPSLSNLDFLGRLNLSHNYLSGRIPSGHHLQSFNDPSIYSDNHELCGWPLTECSINEPSQSPSHDGESKEEEKDETGVIWIYGIAASGFIIGFWTVIGTLLIKISWRITYFRLVDRFYDWVYVKFAISIARWKSIILKN